jgi:Pentapeptide repeats (8 copies)
MADLSQTDFSGANLSEANLHGANLDRTQLISSDFRHADLTGSSIYGIAAWDVKLNADTKQQNLIMTPPGDPVIMVDNIKVAQFIYLLLNNEEIRDVIDTITSKAVLILGRFSDDRKPILNALRGALRNKGFLPILFDFERPKGRDFTETIMTLAGMSCFVIADITNPKSAPLELQATVPNYMIPFVPILQDGEAAFSMFLNLQTKYRWVLDGLGYNSSDTLVEVLDEAVINPALKRRDELEQEKMRNRPTRHVDDYRKRPRSESTS